MMLSRVPAVVLALLAPVALTRADEVRSTRTCTTRLHELKEARVELKEAKHDFGGHREKALLAVDAAIAQMDNALKGAGDPFKGGKVNPDLYKNYKHHPHLHHAVHELKETRVELKEAKHDFGGHREKALKDVDYAIEQLELALKFARKK